MNSGLTAVKVVLPVVIIGAFMVSKFDPANFSAPTFSPFGFEGILTSVSTGGVIFAFLGFRHAIDLAGEAKSPHRTVPLALLLAIVFCLVIYLGAQAAFIGALPPEQVAKGWQSLNFEHDYGPFAEIGLALGLVWLMSVIYAAAIIAPFGGGLVSTGSNARLAMAMATNEQFPKLFAKLSPRGVPLHALLLNWGIGTAMLLLTTFEQMVSLTSSSIVLSLAAGPVAVYALRRQLPDRYRYFRLPAVGIVANLAFIGTTFTLYWSGWEAVKTLLILIAVGLVLFALFRKLAGDGGPLDTREAAWLVPYLAGVGLLSYFGHFGGGTALIPFGWDLALAAGLSLLSFVHAARCRLPAAAVLVYLAPSGMNGENAPAANAPARA